MCCKIPVEGISVKMPRVGILNHDRMLESSEEFKNTKSNFTHGSGLRNLPGDAGDTGSIPAPRGFRMLWGGKAQVLQPLSPCSPTREARALQQRPSEAKVKSI